MKTSGGTKLSPKHVLGSVGEAMCCFALAQAAQVAIDPTIHPVLEKMYAVEVRSGNAEPSGAVKKELTQIHGRLCNAVESAGFSVSDLCQAVTICSSGVDTRDFARVARTCAQARKLLEDSEAAVNEQPQACGRQLSGDQC